jgi:hypothetical protein
LTIDAGRIDLAQEAARAAVVLGDDGVGVLRAVGVDVGHRGVDVVDDLDRDDGAEIFLVPVGFHRGLQLVGGTPAPLRIASASGQARISTPLPASIGRSPAVPQRRPRATSSDSVVLQVP